MKQFEPIVPEGLGEHASALKEYSDYIIEGCDAEELDNFMASGSVSYVFKLDESTVGKIPQAWREDCITQTDADEARDVISRTIPALHDMLGMPGVEQLRSWDSSDPLAWCTEYVPGKSLGDCVFGPNIEVQFEGLLDAVETLVAADICIDAVSCNFIYHPKDGFTVIDYARSSQSWRDTVQDPMHHLALTLRNLADPEVLFDGYRESDGIPEEAFIFRGLCHERYGPAVSGLVDGRWRESIYANQWQPSL